MFSKSFKSGLPLSEDDALPVSPIMDSLICVWHFLERRRKRKWRHSKQEISWKLQLILHRDVNFASRDVRYFVIMLCEFCRKTSSLHLYIHVFTEPHTTTSETTRSSSCNLYVSLLHCSCIIAYQPVECSRKHNEILETTHRHTLYVSLNPCTM